MQSKSSAISPKELVIGLLILLTGAAGMGGYRARRLYMARGFASEKVSLYLSENVPVEQAAARLISKGVRLDRKEMSWAASLFGLKTARRGHYVVEGPVSYRSLLRRLAEGRQDPVRVMVLPGIDRQTFIESVSARMAFPQDSLKAALNDRDFLRPYGVTPATVSGRLWADTYTFYWTASARSLVARMLDTFQEKTAGLNLRSTSLSPDQVLTLASIVEWESKDAEERRMIAGLYLNRLRRGMRLQADPTVAYAIGSRRRLTFDDYKVDHPYNTYRIDGLPPGPINNPSIESIKAALSPVSHGYIYMVASPTGRHVFTSTWEQHKVESEKWRRWLRQQVRLKEEREAAESRG